MKKQQTEKESKTKPYDLLIIELQKDSKSVGSCSIKHEDLDMLLYHKGSIQEILADMYMHILSQKEVETFNSPVNK